MKFTSSIALTLVISLAACGGSSDNGTNTVEAPHVSAGAFQALVSKQTELLTKYHHADSTTPANMPQTGKATYQGVIGFGQRTITTESIDGVKSVQARRNRQIADIQLEADFAKDTLSGNVSNFKNKNNNSLPGSLTITNGVIKDSGFNGAKVSGDVAFDGVHWSNVTGTAGGNFVGHGAEGINGNMYILKETADGAKESADGYFVAEKQ